MIPTASIITNKLEPPELMKGPEEDRAVWRVDRDPAMVGHPDERKSFVALPDAKQR